MWCGKCQSDVGTEVAPDNRRVLCAICSHALGETAVSQLEQPRRPSRTNEARELLDRWANSRPLDPFGPPKKRVTEENLATSPAPMTPLPTPIATVELTRGELTKGEPAPVIVLPERRDEFGESSSEATRASDLAVNAELDRLASEIMSRVDKLTRGSTDTLEPSEPVVQQPLPKSEISHFRSEISDLRSQIGPSGQQPASEPVAQQPLLSSEISDLRSQIGFSDRQPAPALTRHNEAFSPPRPAFAPSVATAPITSVPAPLTQSVPVQSPSQRKLSLMGNVGQLLTYVGILGLTAGLCLVIFGYFGGPPNFAPTGWLITTLGQMLLFLGVVTLVTVGMEQASANVRSAVEERMNSVVERIERLGNEIVRIEHRGHDASTPAPHIKSSRTPQETLDPSNRT